MASMRKIISELTVSALVLLVVAVIPTAAEHPTHQLHPSSQPQQPTPSDPGVTVFSKGEGGYECIKIPYLFSTFNGSLIAFGEGRTPTCSDYASTDLVYKISYDQGATWSQLRVLYSNSTKTELNVIGNAAPVQDRASSNVIVPFCRNNKEVWQTISYDQGETWTFPVQLSNVTLPEWQWVGTGPPASLQLSSGRIITPSYHSTVPNDNGELSEGHVMISDDAGESWYLSEFFDFGDNFPNECQAVQLSNGTVFINSRGILNERIGLYSNDGGLTWPTRFAITTLPQPIPGCQGSTVLDTRTDTLYFTGLHEAQILRFNLSLHSSIDGGATWNALEVIDQGATAYSSLAQLNNGSIALLYEWARNEQIIFEPDYFSYRIVVP